VGAAWAGECVCAGVANALCGFWAAGAQAPNSNAASISSKKIFLDIILSIFSLTGLPDCLLQLLK
jgi:hypothetical protein